MDKINWQPRPVLRLDLSKLDYRTVSLQTALHQQIEELAQQYSYSVSKASPKQAFADLLRQLQEQHQQQVAVLIDEYDKPIIDFLEDYEQADANREVLGEFYGVLKSSGNHIHFILLTGVSKFTKASIFSKLNNLNDLTVDPRYTTLLGITQQEVGTYFAPYIQQICQRQKITEEALLAKIKFWYNGYSWDGKNFVYNPFSLLNFFAKQVFQLYWFATGTPTFLVKAMRQVQAPIDQLETKLVHYSFLDKFNVDRTNIYALLFQTGYLTIYKNYEEFSEYELHYPNNEVRSAFLNLLLTEYTQQTSDEFSHTIRQMRTHLFNGDTDEFMESLKAVFADLSYHWQPKAPSKKAKNWVLAAQKTAQPKLWEGYFHAITYLLLKLLGIHIQAEITTFRGRIDAVITVEKYLYVMEFKLGKAEEAMKQIHAKQYYAPYTTVPQQVILLGVGFSEKDRTVGKWLVEKLP